MTPEAIVDAAVEARISIVALTDHNTIQGVRAAMSRGATHDGKVLVIPGVEITTPQGHLLVYFDPREVANLDRFLASLTIIDDDQDSRTTASMHEVISRAWERGGVCVAAHIDVKKGFESGHPGYDAWKKDVLCHAGLVGLEFREPINSAWFSGNEPAAPGGPENRRRLFAERTKVPKIRARGALARFINSDAHTLVDFAKAASVTRIKLTELNYASFISALADPEARVKIDVGLPRAVPRIVGMDVRGGFLGDQEVHFSPNLNVFFGGRGSGKTSAVRAIAFALGKENPESAPFDTVRLFCEDADGTRYRFDRTLGGQVSGRIQSQDDKIMAGITGDVFPVEYLGQGELNDVAKQSLSNSATLQTFLDNHLQLAGLMERERVLTLESQELATQLAPLLTIAQSRSSCEKQIQEVQAQLKASEEGKLHLVAAFQNKLNAERSYRAALLETARQYRRGVNFRNHIREPREMLGSAGVEEFSTTAAEKALAAAAAVVDETNDYLTKATRQIGADLTSRADKVERALEEVDSAHKQIQDRIDAQLDRLRAENLASSLKEFERISARKSELVAKVARIDAQKAQLDELNERFEESLTELHAVRSQIEAARKNQVDIINRTFQRTFKQYTVRLVPDSKGITGTFEAFIDQIMHGSRFTREQTGKLARAIEPDELASLLMKRDASGIQTLDGVGEWAAEVLARLGTPSNVLHLRSIWKPYLPAFKVWASGGKPREVAFATLSDGQKHTILLTVALLSDSRSPLILDQPEDDLDNEFIFDTVVATLRDVKEMRQVILVTHNANIAVLGDSEQLLGMEQSDGRGRIATRGSIDESSTKEAVQKCLEGGEVALRRRAEVYGWETVRSTT